ncbi:MAG TPA: DNA polymerase III subunit gamma/tau [Candidatus Saccharimonadales bacterium]|nr:DNA polymerase III subunit gamma/tau [Candidatus Saccharimonadales bacterium]
MSAGALYRKYRSKSFKEVIGQEHITTTLVNSIKNNSFAHAYLFTGPRGVGKTSVARLFAFAINGLDYSDEQIYSDIIEIDAASNRRIDEIRELREKVNITPSALKYKVYIIDEVHMLTKEAFNALLKTLEEPPEHAVFVLATTDFHKVPDTITSRCIRFAFSGISVSDIKKHLDKIAKKESIDIEDSALDVIAENADGSFRDAISLLDQFRNSAKTIKTEYVARILGLSPKKEIAGLIDSVAASDSKQVIKGIDKLRGSGASNNQIARQLVGYLRDCLLNDKSPGIDRQGIVTIIKDLLAIDNYANSALALELALLSAVGDKKADTLKQQGSDSPKVRPANEIKTGPNPSNPKADPSRQDLWQDALDSLKNNNGSLYSIARMAEAKYADGVLELYFKFPFHYKQMAIEKNHLLVKKALKQLDDNFIEVKLFLKQANTDRSDKSQPAGDSVESISNIFGPSEVLES